MCFDHLHSINASHDSTPLGHSDGTGRAARRVARSWRRSTKTSGARTSRSTRGACRNRQGPRRCSWPTRTTWTCRDRGKELDGTHCCEYTCTNERTIERTETKAVAIAVRVFAGFWFRSNLLYIPNGRVSLSCVCLSKTVLAFAFSMRRPYLVPTPFTQRGT